MSVVPLVTNCVLHKKTPSKEGVGKLPVTGEEENFEVRKNYGMANPREGSSSGGLSLK